MNPIRQEASCSSLFWTTIRDVPGGGAGCGMAVLAMILNYGCTTRLIRRKSQGYARPAPARRTSAFQPLPLTRRLGKGIVCIRKFGHIDLRMDSYKREKAHGTQNTQEFEFLSR